MTPASHLSPTDWPQTFRRQIVSANLYWLNQLQTDFNRTVPEAANILKAARFGLALSAAWEAVRAIMLHLGPLLIRQGHGAAWEELFLKGVSRCAQANDPTEIELRLHLGHLYRLRGQLPQARQFFSEALQRCDDYGQRNHYYSLLSQLALVARLSGQHEAAIAYCQQVFEGARTSLSLTELAEAFSVMGLVAFDRRQWEEARNYFDQALEVYSQQGSTYDMARMLNNRGLGLLRSGQWAEAEQSFLEAIQKFQATDDQIEQFKSTMNLGNVYLMRKEYQPAIDHYQTALPRFRAAGYVIDAANAYNNLGMAFAGLQEWSVAEAHYLTSASMWRILGDAYNLANVLDNLGVMFIEAEQPDQAEAYLVQALQTLDPDPKNVAHHHLREVVEKRLAQLRAAGQHPN